ncbi:hypothetical protein D3C78_1290600 [compost metagenome]
MGRILERGDRLILDDNRPPLDRGKLFAEPGRRLARLDARITRHIVGSRPPRKAAHGQTGNSNTQYIASRKVDGFRRDIRLMAVGCFRDFDQHGYSAVLENRCTNRLRSMREITSLDAFTPTKM